MNKLSEQQVDKLNSAIDKVMDIMEDKPGDPNDAIVKVAQDMHLTEDYIPVIVAAYNNGTQYATREKGKTISEKTAKFNVANADIIRCKLYGSNKTASYNYVSDDNFFDFSASYYTNAADSAKYANLMYSPCLMQKKARKNIKTVFRDEQNLVDSVNSTLDTVSMYKSAAMDSYDDAIKDLAYYLKRVDAPSVPYAIKLAASVYGVEGQLVIKEAALRFSLPLKDKRQEPVVPATSQFYIECNKCLEKAAEYNRVCDDELQLLSASSKVLKPVVSRRINAIYKQSSISNSSPKYFFEKKKYELKQAASIFPEALSAPDHGARGSKLLGSDVSGLESLVRPQFRTLNPYEHNIMRSLDDPEQEAKLRDIAISANLTELMNTDEYLSDKDPEEVIDAFNELMEIAPEIHNKKPLLRAALRQYMESGGIDMQSLGVIGDVGRKTETRRDEERRLLSENVNKAIESEEKAREAATREAQEMARYMLRHNLTVSEGRKDRMARAEEARKDRSERRKLQDAQNEYDKFKLRMETLKSLTEKDIDARARLSQSKIQMVSNLAKALDDRVHDAMSSSNKYNIDYVNTILSNENVWNGASYEDREMAIKRFIEYGGDPTGLFSDDKYQGKDVKVRNWEVVAPEISESGMRRNLYDRYGLPSIDPKTDEPDPNVRPLSSALDKATELFNSDKSNIDPMLKSFVWQSGTK